MNKKEYNPDEEYASRIKEALELYGLEEGDLGKLIGTSGRDIKNIIIGERALGLRRANRISSVFGMKYFQFGNPSIKLLPQDRLPKRTIDVIAERKKKGPSDIQIDTELNLPIHTMEVLSKLNFKDEFTAKQIYEQLPEYVKSKVEANRLTVLFKTGSLRKYVEYAGIKQENRHIYRFISEEIKKSMEEVLAGKDVK